jgi:diguanylate cyclase (GGDEF)-like protein
MFVALGMQLLIFEDMTDELRRQKRDLEFANREIKNLAITDPLTGCHNRRFFEEIERREIQRHRRYGAPLSIVFTDVNHFKRFNDTMGHEMGDRILTNIGAFLRRQVRESDYVIRWGGDEFLILLTCSYSEAQRKAAELKVAFERERVAGSLPDGLGLSIGVASAPVDADSLAATVREADSRMYQDKLGDRSASAVK